MTLTVHFENRDFTKYAPRHWDSLRVDNYVNTVFGRSKKVKVTATGSKDDLPEFLQMMRNPIYIFDEERAKNVWWGYLNRATVFGDGFPQSVSMDNMANRIAVAYTYQFNRFTTAFSANAESVTEFGKKELLLMAREKSTAMAEQIRATELASRKYPILEPAFKSRRGNKLLAVLNGKGWMKSLSWQYYDQDEGNVSYEDFGSGEREIGEDDRPIAAQAFKLGSAAGWTITALWLRVRKIGTPADNFQVSLFDSSSSVPNVSLTGTPNLTGANITTSYVWYEFILDTPFAASTATEYWIHVKRSGAVDSSNFYMIDANKDQGYADGNLFIKPSGAWYDKKMDALFRVVGEEATTAQIIDIVTDAGEFFLGTDIINASGVNSTMFRAGDQTALYEIIELLKTGTTNNRRLLAEVTDVRNLRVFEEPAKDQKNYSLDNDDVIRDENDNIVPPQECPVGIWMTFKDFIPATVNTSKLIDGSTIFVEEAMYDALRDQYRILKTRSGVSAAESLTQQISIG